MLYLEYADVGALLMVTTVAVAFFTWVILYVLSHKDWTTDTDD